MTPVERAQLDHLRRCWHDYADRLVDDQCSLGGFQLLDWVDYVNGSGPKYHADGRRKGLDS